MTLYDFGIEITKIREAINSLEVKGEQNASLIVYAFRKCNDLITAINEISSEKNEEIQNGNNDTQEGGEVNGQ